MADITMCVSDNCPYNNECYRKTVKPRTLQSYSDYGTNCNIYNRFQYYMKSIHNNK